MEHGSNSGAARQCKGEVFAPAGLVNYAEGAVVSRTIVENGGEVRITVGGKPHHLKSGESIIMPADIPHALSAVTAFKMMLVMIKA